MGFRWRDRAEPCRPRDRLTLSHEAAAERVRSFVDTKESLAPPSSGGSKGYYTSYVTREMTGMTAFARVAYRERHERGRKGEPSERVAIACGTLRERQPDRLTRFAF